MNARRLVLLACMVNSFRRLGKGRKSSRQREDPMPGQVRARCELAIVLSALGCGDRWVQRAALTSKARPFIGGHVNGAQLAIDARQLALDFCRRETSMGGGADEAFKELCQVMEERCDADGKAVRRAANQEARVREQARTSALAAGAIGEVSAPPTTLAAPLRWLTEVQ
jgi:hypothetical protein